jgi:hypothetical protein
VTAIGFTLYNQYAAHPIETPHVTNPNPTRPLV